jgi:hypothetical protein
MADITKMPMKSNRIHDLVAPIRALHIEMRDAILQACEDATTEELTAASADLEGDIIYGIDRISEETLVEKLADFPEHVLIAEGIAPRENPQATLRIIVDPIDGTRGLMYQKRPAWILTGVAPDNGPETSLQDIELAVQTEIPLLKQHLCDQLWVVKGEPVFAERFNRLTGESTPLNLQPSRAKNFEHGFCSFSRFFPGTGVEMSKIEAAFTDRLIPPPADGRAVSFEDQYICNAGQLYELMAGHDRFIADIRPVIDGGTGPSARPYDLCTELIAHSLGVAVTGPDGKRVNAPLDTTTPVSWIGYANDQLRQLAEPVLMALLRGL